MVPRVVEIVSGSEVKMAARKEAGMFESVWEKQAAEISIVLCNLSNLLPNYK